MKRFNTTGTCFPAQHYMVDISKRVADIKQMVDDGKYFTINRARQYGKTTTLIALAEELRKEYVVISMSFEGIGDEGFADQNTFVVEFCRLIRNQYDMLPDISDEIKTKIDSLFYNRFLDHRLRLGDLFDVLQEWCNQSERKIVLIIDEVDSATNNEVFISFLGQLRKNYLNRNALHARTFQSVILAGVTDVKHLKSKIRKDENAKQNSPWNIAANFNINMSLSEKGIKGMLDEYENDHHTGMDTASIAAKIRSDTNGYPYLVSRICQVVDEELVPDVFPTPREAWTLDGVENAVKGIVMEKSTLFDSLMGKLKCYPEINAELKRVLFQGETMDYRPDYTPQEQLLMFGFIANRNGNIAVDNRIFEMRLYKYYTSESVFSKELREEALEYKPMFIKDGILNVPLIMKRFIKTQEMPIDMTDGDARKKFIEEEGREKFLTYLAPILNGVGTFSVEERTRNRRRMDVVIHCLGKRYIIELKIWRGERYNSDGEKQISDYLDSFGLTTGYMLSFNFNKNKKSDVDIVHVNGKLLYEGIV